MTQIRRDGPKPAHQNSYAFKHNRASKTTQKILASPNIGLCKRCHDIIEWKKAYRKYKPLTQPRRCNICQQKTITLAYHVICNACAKEKKQCAKCCEPYDEKLQQDETLQAELKELDEIEKKMSGMSLRKQFATMREVVRLEMAKEAAEEGENNGEPSTKPAVSAADFDDFGSDDEDEFDEDDL